MPDASNTNHLPINDVLPELLSALNNHDEAVLQAEPGAGKTTRVPLALLQPENNQWLQGQRILMLEPRRLAARNAATFMAKQLEEEVGQTVGYRVRFESKVSSKTRIEVITEGILNRYLQNDPSMEGVGLIIFDEFHERSLDADLGLALALQGRQLFRESSDGSLPLKLLIMSATLDDSRIADMLGSEHHSAPIIKSKGRQYPVEIFYEPQKISNTRHPNPERELTHHTVHIIQQAVTNDDGSILVFLPGQKEIRNVQKLLHEKLLTEKNKKEIIIAPLFGELNLQEQQLAIAPVNTHQRKVVLATAIAESSLTIHGVNIVIDAGKSRVAAFDARTGMTRLKTIRLSKAASVQRAGRAGRLQAGRCYRLWSASQQQQLAEYAQPEILQADLAPLALQLIHWGIHHPDELNWLDSPPNGAYQQAMALLCTLGAIQHTHEGETQTKIHMTAHGQAMAQLPAHPRIAHMLLVGKNNGLTHLACQLAALLTERDILHSSHDEGRRAKTKEAAIHYRLDILNNKNNHGNHQTGAIKRIEQQIQQFKRLLKGHQKNHQSDVKSPIQNPDSLRWVGFLIACAYPDRVAKQRSPTHKTTPAQEQTYLLSNGRAATLRQPDSLESCQYLAVSTLGGQQNDNADQIYLAAELDSSLFNNELAHLIRPYHHVEWNHQTERFSATQEQRLGTVIIESKKLNTINDEDKRKVIFELIRKRGLELLPWNNTIRQWQARVHLLHTTELKATQHTLWPDVSDAALIATMENWLGPYVQSIRHINDFKKLDLHVMLMNLLPWPLPNKLNELAPTHITVPSGSHIPIDYTQVPPVLAIRLQEMFGCTQTPHIANGHMPLTLHLLSPARRPLQITRDLASFWQNTYPEVKKDMKGRYPKHHWPDNPMEAIPTARIKPRSK